MTIDEVKDYILTKLGSGNLEVELTDKDIDTIIRDTNRWFVVRVGFKTVLKIQSNGSGLPYQLPPFVTDVASVRFENDPLNGIMASSPEDAALLSNQLFGPLTGSGYGGYGYQMAQHPYSAIVQMMQTLKVANRVLNGDPEWDYDIRTKTLTIGPYSAASGTMIVEVFSNAVDPRCLEPEEEDLYLRWALAEAKELLGEIRSKHDSLPTVGGDRSLNGADLIQRAQAEKEKIDQSQVLNRIRSTPFVIG